MKKLIIALAAVLSFTALLCFMLFARAFGDYSAANGVNPATGDYLNIAIYASLGVLALLIILLTATAKSKRR